MTHGGMRERNAACACVQWGRTRGRSCENCTRACTRSVILARLCEGVVPTQAPAVTPNLVMKELTLKFHAPMPTSVLPSAKTKIDIFATVGVSLTERERARVCLVAVGVSLQYSTCVWVWRVM